MVVETNLVGMLTGNLLAAEKMSVSKMQQFINLSVDVSVFPAYYSAFTKPGFAT